MQELPEPSPTPHLSWATARQHNLVPGDIFLGYGYKREKPNSFAVRLMYVGGPEVKALTEQKELVSLGKPQTRFWATVERQATPESQAEALAVLEAGTMLDMGSVFKDDQVARARAEVEAPDGPVHPGRHWLLVLDKAGMSQSEAARQMGISPMTLNRLVNGQGIPTARVTVEFARVAGQDVNELWQQVSDYELAVALAAPLQG